MAVLTAVTATGRRGWPAGGQVTLPRRKTRKAPTSPAKNIASAPRKASMASRALLTAGPAGGQGSGGGGSPPKSGGTPGGAVITCSSRSRTGTAVSPLAIPPPSGDVRIGPVDP